VFSILAVYQDVLPEFTGFLNKFVAEVDGVAERSLLDGAQGDHQHVATQVYIVRLSSIAKRILLCRKIPLRADLNPFLDPIQFHHFAVGRSKRVPEIQIIALRLPVLIAGREHPDRGH